MRAMLLPAILALHFLQPSLYAEGIDEVQRMAQENYPLIKRYGLIEQTEQFTLGNIQKGWLPQVSAYAHATYQSDVVALPDALQNMMQQMGGSDIRGLKRDQYKVGIDVTQTIYDGGATAHSKRVARAQTSVGTAQTDVSMYAVRERVNEIFFSILLADKRVALLQERMSLLLASEQRLDAMVRQGVATESDLNAMRAERLTVSQQTTLLKAQRTTLTQVLSIFCGKEICLPLTPPKEEDMKSNTVRDYARPRRPQRPELLLLDRQRELADAQERALKSGLLPRLSVFASAFYGYPGYNMYEDMMRHRWSWNGMAGAKLTWNIGSLYTNKNDRAKLQLQREQIENERETFLFNNNLGRRQEDGTIDAYRKMLSEDDEIINLRSSVRQSAESKLAHGIIDVTSLIQEITRENEARINKATHEVEMMEHIYRLKIIDNR